VLLMCSQVYPEKDRAHALDKGEAIKLLKGGTFISVKRDLI
jgi:hypothetical protein